MGIQCFLIEPSGEAFIEVSASWGECPKNPYSPNAKGHHARSLVYSGPEPQQDKESESRWNPFQATCEYCGANGGMQGPGSICNGNMWRRKDTGETHRRIANFGVGAMWFADWYKRDNGLYGWDWDNQTTPPLIVRTPGGDWVIDSRASNCTKKEDRTHRCWVRHGEPPIVTVDKNGNTCAAGAGSIQCGNYHGFLRSGYLT